MDELIDVEAYPLLKPESYLLKQYAERNKKII